MRVKGSWNSLVAGKSLSEEVMFEVRYRNSPEKKIGEGCSKERKELSKGSEKR